MAYLNSMHTSLMQWLMDGSFNHEFSSLKVEGQYLFNVYISGGKIFFLGGGSGGKI